MPRFNCSLFSGRTLSEIDVTLPTDSSADINAILTVCVDVVRERVFFFHVWRRITEKTRFPKLLRRSVIDSWMKRTRTSEDLRRCYLSISVDLFQWHDAKSTSSALSCETGNRTSIVQLDCRFSTGEIFKWAKLHITHIM